MRTVLELIFEHLFEEVAELILSLEDYLLLCRVHINVDLLRGDIKRHVEEIRVASLGLVGLISCVYGSLDLV